MSTSQRVWLVILLTVFGGAAVEQLMDMDTLPSVIVGIVAAVLIAILTSTLLLVRRPEPCPVPVEADKPSPARKS